MTLHTFEKLSYDMENLVFCSLIEAII